MGLLDWLGIKTQAAKVEDLERSRAMTAPIYRHGELRRGITSSSQQTTAQRLVTDGFRSTQATAARAVSGRLSDLAFVVEEKERAEDGSFKWIENPTHPLLDMLERPNPLLSRRQMLKLASYWITQAGECYWLIVRNGVNKAAELWPMAPQNIEKLSSDLSPVSGFIFHGEAGETRYGLEEVVYIFDPDPADPFQGVGVVGPQANDYDAQSFAASTMRSHYQHDAVPKTVLKAGPEAQMPDGPQKEMFWADWQNRYNQRGGENQGVPAFLPSGFDIEKLAEGQTGADTTAVLAYFRDQLLMANGVPRSILGDVVDANRAAADTNRLVFDRHVIKPQTGLIADALTHQLAVPDYGRLTRIGFEPFISEDDELRLKEENQDLTNKVRSVNQVLADRGRDPVDWGELPVGTFGQVPYDPDDFEDDDDDSGLGGPLGEENEPPSPDDDDSEPGNRAFLSRIVAPRIAAKLTAENEWSRVMQIDAVYVPRMLSALRRVFAMQKTLTVDALKAAPAAQRSYSRADWIDELFAGVEFSRLFDSLITPISLEVYTTTSDSVFFALEERPQLEFNESAIKEMREQGAQLVTLANETTKRALRKTISKGIENGESLDQQISRVQKAYRQISRGRARTIARTEVGYAMSKGQADAFEASPSVFYTKWNTALDERVRDQHVAMNGVQVREGELFQIPPIGKLRGEKARAPRVAADGGRLLPHNGINCRCFDTAVLGE